MRFSVRARLTLWFSLVSFCVVLVLGTVACLGLRTTMNKVVDGELSSRMDGVDNFLTEHVVRLPDARVQQELTVHVALKPAFAVVRNPDGELLFCGASVKVLCGATGSDALRAFSIDENLRVLSATRVIRGAPYRIRLASDLSFQRSIRRQFVLWLLLVAPLALLLSTLGGYWLSRRALLPVCEIIDAIHSIGEHSLSLRLKVPSTGDEIQKLSETLNGMLGRVESGFQRVTELTANASHELRTPMCIIRTAAEIALLNARPTAGTHRLALLQICGEAEKNTRLLDNMLLLARSDSGSQTLTFADLPVEKSLRQAANACHHLAEAKNVSLLVLDDAPGLRLWADASHLNRLWSLLLDNAIKYTPRGGKVTARILAEANGAPVCEVTDTGIGIEPKDQTRIFDRFFRAENARLTAAVGSGLGLAIASWIAEVHQAKICVVSDPGIGSTFRVTFSAEVRNAPSNTPRVETVRLR